MGAPSEILTQAVLVCTPQDIAQHVYRRDWTALKDKAFEHCFVAQYSEVNHGRSYKGVTYAATSLNCFTLDHGRANRRLDRQVCISPNSRVKPNADRKLTDNGCSDMTL